MDFILTNHGNVSKLYAFTDKAKQWLKGRVARKWLQINRNIAAKVSKDTVEISSNTSLEIVGALENEGLKVQY